MDRADPVPGAPVRLRAAGGWRRLVSTYWYAAVVALTVAFLVSVEISRRPASPAELIWLMHTGALVFLVALAAARRIPPAVPATIRRIRLLDQADQEVADPQRVLAALEAVRRRYAVIGVPTGVVLMGVFWWWAAGSRVLGNPLFWLELVAAGAAGWVVGGFVAYGRLGHVLNTLGLRPLAVPGHPDGAAGLRPVGALFLRQALIVALIGLFAGIWWLLFPIVKGYGNWSDPYLGIVLVCVVLEAAALFLPLQSFHRHMVARRAALLSEADAAARRLDRIDGELWRTEDAARTATLESERERAQARWDAIDTMPTWPLDVSIRRRFAWSNLAMLVPVVLQVLNAPQLLQQISSSLTAQ